MLGTLISIENGVIGFLNKPILSGINFEIKAGEHLALVGISGSGKTLLLNALSGNLQLMQGEVMRHYAVSNPNPIAYVQAKHHFRTLSNTTNFYYQQRYNSSDSGDTQTVNDYLKDVPSNPSDNSHWDMSKVIQLLNLTMLVDKHLVKLSNGETKRLMIAAALLKNPLLLLLDNPLTGLDVQTRGNLNNILAKIAAAGTTILMATSPHEIPGVIKRVGIINNGSVTITNAKDFDAGIFQDAAKNEFDLKELLINYPAPAYQHIVAMQNVSINYGNKTVLSQINWQIKQGEHWTLMGPNGAGKSTLLSLINGDNPQAYANNIVLFDKKRGSGESIWDIKKKTGFVSPELYQYFPADSSCLQVVESGYYDTMGLFRPSDLAKARRAKQWLQTLQIGQYAHRLLKNIPGSAQRLCLLARAMIKNPTLLILDEPCQGMDDAQITHFKALVATICQETNLTLIYVTHYAEHIPNCVDKVLKLDNGFVVTA